MPVFADRSARIDDTNNVYAHMNGASSRSPVALRMRSSLAGILCGGVAVRPSWALFMTFQWKDGSIEG